MAAVAQGTICTGSDAATPLATAQTPKPPSLRNGAGGAYGALHGTQGKRHTHPAAYRPVRRLVALPPWIERLPCANCVGAVVARHVQRPDAQINPLAARAFGLAAQWFGKQPRTPAFLPLVKAKRIRAVTGLGASAPPLGHVYSATRLRLRQPGVRRGQNPALPLARFRCALFCITMRPLGAVAQLGERRVRNAKAVGSIPIRSTIKSSTYDARWQKRPRVW